MSSAFSHKFSFPEKFQETWSHMQYVPEVVSAEKIVDIR
jgi:hypothetical protein